MLRERRFDLIHIQTPFRGPLRRRGAVERLGLPRVETYHTFFEEYLHHYVPLVPGSWTRALARRCLARAVQRPRCGRGAVPCHAGGAARLRGPAPVEIIPTGIELDALSEGTAPPSGDATVSRPTAGAGARRPGRIREEHRLPAARAGARACAACRTCCWSSQARARLARICTGCRGAWGSSATCCSSATSTGAMRCSIATAPATHSCSRRVRRLRGWCCWRRWRWGTGGVHCRHGHARYPGAGAGRVGAAREDEEEFAARVVDLLRDPALRARLSRERTSYATRVECRRDGGTDAQLYADVLGSAGLRARRSRASERPPRLLTRILPLAPPLGSRLETGYREKIQFGVMSMQEEHRRSGAGIRVSRFTASPRSCTTRGNAPGRCSTPLSTALVRGLQPARCGARGLRADHPVQPRPRGGHSPAGAGRLPARRYGWVCTGGTSMPRAA